VSWIIPTLLGVNHDGVLFRVEQRGDDHAVEDLGSSVAMST
jgi:hypothetical protein